MTDTTTLATGTLSLDYLNSLYLDYTGLSCVGWVEPFAKPITPNTIIDRYRFATPILCTTRKQAA